jgi:hypothetical protein
MLRYGQTRLRGGNKPLTENWPAEMMIAFGNVIDYMLESLHSLDK